MAPSVPDIPDTLFKAFSPVSTDAWTKKIREDLGEDLESVLVWESVEGITQHAFYRANDRDDLPHLQSVPLTDAAETPANRWRLRQDVMHSDLETAQRHVQDAVNGGVTDIGLHLRVKNGKLRGVPIQRQDDLAELLHDINVADTPIHCTGGPAALVLWAMLCNVADQQAVPLSTLRGSADFDPAAALAQHRMADADRAFGAAAGTTRFASATTPSARLLAVDLRPYHDAGASTVHELALALGACSELLAQLRARDCAPQQVADTLQWLVPIGPSYFIAIAKLRALRVLIPQVFDAFGVAMPPSAPFIQAETSRREETMYGQHVNLLRGTTEAAAAVIGGCDVLTVRPFTAASGGPADPAMRLARNTQLVLQEEAHLDHVADPAAGSYYIEVMTDQLAREAWSLFQRMEAEGGLLATLHDGAVQNRIADVRAERMRRVANREHVLVGATHYPDPEETRPTDDQRRTSLERSGHPIEIRSDAVLTSIRQALSDEVTLGDIMDALAGDETPAFDALPSFRHAEPFEDLRRRTEQWAEQHGGPPRVVLLPMGDPAVRSARANFARNMLGVAGFAIDEHIQFNTPDAAAQAAAEAEADIVVLCSADDAYPTLAPALCTALQDTDIDPLVLVAGHLPDHRADLEAAGVDGFLHKGAPLPELLINIQQRLGIS